MTNLWRDLRHAGRVLHKQPGFTIAAVLTLALGIGANTAVFSVVKHVLLTPLPYAEAERVAVIWSKWRGPRQRPSPRVARRARTHQHRDRGRPGNRGARYSPAHGVAQSMSQADHSP